jgi:sulfatase maturation enzyme AslB (radical SAM superfamily)
MITAMRPTLPFVEMMATQSCNLSCAGCTNYSDVAHKGWVPWSRAQSEIEAWLARVDILDFGIFGGEPLLNPEIRQWIKGVRSLLPGAQIRFTTNGLLLGRNLDIVDLAADVGNIVFKIGVHVKDPALENTIQYVMERFDWQPVIEYGIDRFETGNRFRFQVSRPSVFWKTFQGSYADMRPHDSDPASAFEICCQKTCPLMYQGRIYKCSTVGLLRDTLSKFGRPNLDLWQNFLSNGIGPDCNDQDLDRFLSNFGQPHALCRQCPTRQDLDSRIQHLANVKRQKTKI